MTRPRAARVTRRLRRAGPAGGTGRQVRVLERHRWSGMDFDAQARAIKAMCERYNVCYIGIDTTGIGEVSTSW